MKALAFVRISSISCLFISCATPVDPGRNALLIRPSLTRPTIRLEAGLKGEEAARMTAQGLPVPAATRLEPNTDARQGLSIGYGGYSFSASQSRPVSDEAMAAKGPTKSTDYQFHGALGQLGFDVYWQDYMGMYKSGRPGYEFHPDLQLARKGFNLFYINDAQNYKHNAHMYQTEYQPGSADSLLFLFSFDYLKIRNLPFSIQELYEESLPGDRMEASALSLMLGYAFILKSTQGPWFAANIFAGRSYQLQVPMEQLLSTPAAPVEADKVIVSSSLGIDRASWFLGLSFWVDSITIPLTRMESTVNSSVYELFLGCRL